MFNKFRYYYNQVPGKTPWRNNLIYTSLISEDQKTFVQHYTIDGDYHQGQEHVVDPAIMEQKWQREIRYLDQMTKQYPDLIPKILDIDLAHRKIYLQIDGVDFWQRSLDRQCSFDNVLPDWQDQMLDIVKAHKQLNWYKFSMHPSSYFIVDGRLKSINYFFTYSANEAPISIADHLSHIYATRQEQIKKYSDANGISWDQPQPFAVLEQLCWNSFSNMYPADFIEKVKCIK